MPGLSSFNRESRLARLSLFMGLLILAACQQAPPDPLPTRAASAADPVVYVTIAPGMVPPTFTAAPVTSPQAGVITRPVTATPIPTLTPAPSPTPEVLAITFTNPSTAPYLAEPVTAVPCGGDGLVYRSRFPSAVGGPWRDYHIYLPPCYGLDGRAYPVIFLIHGSIQTDSHWFDLGLAEYADDGIASGRYPAFIAVMPDSGKLGNITSGGPNSIEGVTVDYLLPYIDRSYCTWAVGPGRNIGGISRGGYWALEIAFRHPDRFVAVAGHSSHLRLETDSARYNPLATYAESDLSNTRIWLDRGETDFLRAGQDALHASLNATGIDHVYRVNEGGHNDGYWAAHLPEYLDWHLSAWPRDRANYPECG